VDLSASAPATPISHLIEFERADVITPMIYPPRPRLVVSGVTPYPMEVALVALEYVSRPPYQGIQVVGTLPAGPQPMPAITNIPYAVELDLAGQLGAEGIEVVGATRTERLPVSAPTVQDPN